MITITQLTYILAVSEHQHFGKAAKSCHVSQPSLSAQIHKAEELIGYEIFDRSKSPVLTTDLGAQFIDHARAVLREHHQLLRLGDQNQRVSGDYKLGVIPTLSPYLIPLFLEKFSRTYPKVTLEISELKTETIIDYLGKDKIDGAILVTPLGDKRIHEEPLFLEPFYVFASSSHPLANDEKVRDSHLDATTVWLLEEGHCFRNQVSRVCSLKRQRHLLPNVRFDSGSLETLMNLIRQGEGYTLIPYLAGLHLNETDKKKHLRAFHTPVPSREVSLVCIRKTYKKSISEAIAASIRDCIPDALKGDLHKHSLVVDI